MTIVKFLSEGDLPTLRKLQHIFADRAASADDPLEALTARVPAAVIAGLIEEIER